MLLRAPRGARPRGTRRWSTGPCSRGRWRGAPSPARLAITSLAFMFDEVPEPVWKTSIGNWSSCSPAATASAAVAMRSARSASSSPRSALTRAAAPLIRPSQRTTGSGLALARAPGSSRPPCGSPRPKAPPLAPFVARHRFVCGQPSQRRPAAAQGAGTRSAGRGRRPPRWPAKWMAARTARRRRGGGAGGRGRGSARRTRRRRPACRRTRSRPGRSSARCRSAARRPRRSPCAQLTAARVTRIAELVMPIPAASSSSSSLGSSSRGVSPASCSSRQKSFRGLAKWCPTCAERSPGLMPTKTSRTPGPSTSGTAVSTRQAYLRLGVRPRTGRHGPIATAPWRFPEIRHMGSERVRAGSERGQSSGGP